MGYPRYPGNTLRPHLHICFLCTEKWGQIAGPGLLLLFTDFSLRRQRPLPLPPKHPPRSLAPRTKSLFPNRIWRRAAAAACNSRPRLRSRSVPSCLIPFPFGFVVRRSYRQAEGAEVDERKINLREEGNENNTLAMAGNLKSL